MKTKLFIAAMLFLASCSDKAPIEIDISGKPQLDTITASVFYYDTVTVTCEQTLILKAESEYWFVFGQIDTTTIKYLWTTGDTTPTIAASNLPDHSLNSIGVRISFRVTLNDSSTIDTTYYSSFDESVMVRSLHLPLFVVPYAFSPNNDGMSDFFEITAVCFTSSKLKVYDTFSRSLLFESTDINFGWDGTHKGKKMPAGEYFYQFEITSLNNETIESEGYFDLVR